MITPNYLAFDHRGRLLLSDSGTWGRNDGVVFVLDPTTGAAIWSRQPCSFPNGLALSADGDRLYIVESESSSVWSLGIAADGSVGDGTRIWHVENTVPDGLALDVEGTVYISCYTPDSGYTVNASTGATELLVHDWSGQFVQAPTNIAFLGADLALLGTANLCGSHINVSTGPIARGLPIHRPKVSQWVS